MSEDFDGALHDLEAGDDDNDDGEHSGEEEEAELDRKMGEVDGQDADKLDQKLWEDPEGARQATHEGLGRVRSTPRKERWILIARWAQLLSGRGWGSEHYSLLLWVIRCYTCWPSHVHRWRARLIPTASAASWSDNWPRGATWSLGQPSSSEWHWRPGASTSCSPPVSRTSCVSSWDWYWNRHSPPSSSEYTRG